MVPSVAPCLSFSASFDRPLVIFLFSGSTFVSVFVHKPIFLVSCTITFPALL